MKYQNRVASAIKPEIFQVPFIGKNAFKVQWEQAKKQRMFVEEKLNKIREQLKNLEDMVVPLSTEEEVDVKYRLEVLSRLTRIRDAVKKCKDNVRTLEKNSTLIQKQIQLEALEKIRTELEGKIGVLNQKIGKLQEKIQSKAEQLETALEKQKIQEAEKRELEEKAGEELILWMPEYEKQRKQKK